MEKKINNTLISNNENIDEESVNKKFDELKKYLRELKNVVVAFSGGVDSTFLLKVAHEELGTKAVAITAKSCIFPGREFEETKEFCQRENISQMIYEHNEMNNDKFVRNPKDRCYICKKDMFENILSIAKNNSFDYVIEGSNMDDNGDYRPGLRAISELNIKSPLRYAKLSKEEIRYLSKKIGLVTYKKPSFACLASRFVYGQEITEDKLKMVEAAEEYLVEKGFDQFRVRIHENVARIEILPGDFKKILDESMRIDIYDKFEEIGFKYISLDLKGYRTGSMNEVL